MQIQCNGEELEPLIRQIAAEMATHFTADDRLAYTETEAAKLIGVARHVLRDERLRGRVEHGKCGKKIIYSKKQLLEFIERRKP